jgi:hypothetical protein
MFLTIEKGWLGELCSWAVLRVAQAAPSVAALMNISRPGFVPHCTGYPADAGDGDIDLSLVRSLSLMLGQTQIGLFGRLQVLDHNLDKRFPFLR